jgi:AAHS family 4-hydroxybenzoate transporter-like MFS transporter
MEDLMTSTPLTPAAFIDGRPLSSFQRRIIVLCLLIAFVDGFDALTIGYVIPSLAQALGVGAGALTPVVTAGALGLTMGAIFLGGVGDRRGRRFVIIWGTLGFGIFTGALALAPTITLLALFRFIAGVFLGAVLPNVIALGTEYTPSKHRSAMTGALVLMVSAGGFVGGLLANVLLEPFGYRSIFIIGAVAPIVLVPVVATLMPESMLFLGARGRIEAVKRIVRRIEPTFSAAITPPKIENAEKAPLRQLFLENRAAVTLLLWLCFFCQFLMVFVMSGWAPTLFKEAGMSASISIWATTLITLGTMLGALFLGVALDRRNQDFRLIAIGFAVGVLAVIGIVLSIPDPALVLPLSFLLGFSALATGSGLTSIAAQLYPVSAQATGIAWALTAARVGSFIGPLIVGIFISTGVAPKNIFLMGVVPASLAAVSVLVLVAVRKRTQAIKPTEASTLVGDPA